MITVTGLHDDEKINTSDDCKHNKIMNNVVLTHKLKYLDAMDKWTYMYASSLSKATTKSLSYKKKKLKYFFKTHKL